jgi:hypothetical protein
MAMTGIISKLVERMRPARPRIAKPVEPTPVELNAAAALWADRDGLVVSTDWDEGKPHDGRFSYRIPNVIATLSDGRSVILHGRHAMGGSIPCVTTFEDLWTPKVTLRTEEMQESVIATSPRIAAAWRAVAAYRLARELGMEHHAAGIDPNDPECLCDLLAEIASRNPPRPCEETYMFQNAVSSWKGERPPDPPPFAMATPWKRLSGELLIRTGPEHYNFLLPRHRKGSSWSETKIASVARVSHPSFGYVGLDGTRIDRAMEQARQKSIEQAFGADAIPAAPTVTENARVSRVMALARQAVTADPELADRSGTRIAPLVENHLPRLLDAHAKAMRTATGREVADVDDDLARGLEIVRKAVDEALEIGSRDDRDALRTELRFLELRHPDVAA